jgi:hypothetical protein
MGSSDEKTVHPAPTAPTHIPNSQGPGTVDTSKNAETITQPPRK